MSSVYISEAVRQQVAEAMSARLAAHGVHSRTLELQVDNVGRRMSN